MVVGWLTVHLYSRCLTYCEQTYSGLDNIRAVGAGAAQCLRCLVPDILIDALVGLSEGSTPELKTETVKVNEMAVAVSVSGPNVLVGRPDNY